MDPLQRPPAVGPASPNFIADPRTPRLLSLDVMRGLTIAAMILVTDPGTYSAVYPPLLHAAWQGATPTDMIFPAFLFMVGVSIVYSTRARLARGSSRMQIGLHALRRSVLLILLGLAVNGFPAYQLSSLRLPGILQRIALCYLCATLLYLAVTPADERASDSVREGVPLTKASRTRRPFAILAGILALLLAGYWLLLRFTPVPGFGTARYDSLGYLGAYVDRAIFTVPHLWAWGLTPGHGVTYDPEGLLSTLPAITNTLLGLIAGLWLRTDRTLRAKLLVLALAGMLFVAAGWLLSPWMPINKRIWTSTFALLSGGVSLLALAFLSWLIDLRSIRRWTPPALIFGTNAILAFVLSSVITASLDSMRMQRAGTSLSLHSALHQVLFASWLPPRPASLAYALAIVALNALLLYPLYRRKIFVRL